MTETDESTDTPALMGESVLPPTEVKIETECIGNGLGRVRFSDDRRRVNHTLYLEASDIEEFTSSLDQLLNSIRTTD
jgi:hypothetical protein